MPDDTILTVRILKTPQTLDIIHEKLGSEQIIPGAPWTFDDALLWAEREFSIHLNDRQEVTLVLDNQIPHEAAKISEEFGLRHLYALSNYSVLTQHQTLNDAELSNETNLPLSSLRSRIGGEIIAQGDTPEHFSFSLSKKWLTIHGIGQSTKAVQNVALPDNAEILALFTSSPEDIGISSIASEIVQRNLSDTLANAMYTLPTTIVISEDSKGTVITLNIKTFTSKARF